MRVDQILAVKKTSDALPFTLPPLPKVNFEHTTLLTVGKSLSSEDIKAVFTPRKTARTRCYC